MERIAHAIDDIALMAGICRSKVYSEINRGKLRAIKIGRRTVVLDQDFNNWIESQPTYTPILSCSKTQQFTTA